VIWEPGDHQAVDTTRMEKDMAAVTLPSPATEQIRVPAAAWVAVAFGLAIVYLILQENGALLANSWESLHELFHDGRHALGVPCH